MTLKETSIESMPYKENGRKRSFEESRDGPHDSPENGDDRRKRSRETTPNDGQNPELAQSKDTNAANMSQNVSESKCKPEHPLPAPQKDLAKEDPVVKVPQMESLETHVDSSANFRRSAENSDLPGDSEFEASDERSGGSDGDSSSFWLEEFRKPETRNSRELCHEPVRAQHTEPWEAQQVGETCSLQERTPSEDASGPRNLDSPGSSASIEPPAYSSFDLPHSPKDPNISPETKSNEDQPTREDVSSGSGEFEGDPKSQSDDNCDSHASISRSRYEVSVGSPNAETTVHNPPKVELEQDEGSLQDPDELKDISKPQEKPLESTIDPETHSNDRSPSPIPKQPGIWIENNINTDTLSQETSNSETSDIRKGLNKKRSREQLERASPKKAEINEDSSQETGVGKDSTKSTAEDEREKKRHRDDSEERESKTNKLFSASAFASAAADSPFAKLAGVKPPSSTETPGTTDKPASSSAFAGSALGGFAGSEKSPFGTLGASTSSVFKSASPFAAAPSTTGFGGIGGGFASAAGKTSFASPNVSSTFGETKSKPLGAEESENEEEEGEGEDETNTFEAAKTDERFFEQTIETGEEGEKTIFACKAKLFSFTAGEWKERGLGTFKVNARDVNGKQVGRMIMRADGALRVMLNSPVFEGMNYGDAKNKAPTNKQIFLASTEEGRTVPLLLRTPNESYALDLYKTIRKLLTGEEEDEGDDEDE
ncbi:hypothetical protein VI817_000799 [Penicillium citrinum]|nr:hypothetical protein VI817_000799 [Penicillium citrinum]